MQSFDVAAVVSGGASGLGEATVRALVARGAAVTVADLNEERSDHLVRGERVHRSQSYAHAE